MASVHARLIRSLTQMGGGPAPWAPANLAGTAAIFGASAVCTVAYTLWGSSGVPGTHKSSLWQEATNAYLKFQGADPISYPEVGKPKFEPYNEIYTPDGGGFSANDAARPVARVYFG